MKKLIVKRSDGGISIIIPAKDATAESLERDAKAVEGYVSHRECEDSEMPSFRDFRDAWVDNGKLEHDISKCKEIKKNHFRQLRKPLLEALDVEYQRADEANDAAKKGEIAVKKQELRDITAIAMPDDVMQLKAFIPEFLKRAK